MYEASFTEIVVILVVVMFLSAAFLRIKNPLDKK